MSTEPTPHESEERLLPRLRYRHCPMCRATLTRAVDAGGLKRSGCPDCGWIHYPANATGVNVVVTTDDGIVVLLPDGEPQDTPAALPGGHLEYGESPEAGAIREAREETGLTVEVVRCLGWYFYPGPAYPGPMISFHFETRATGGHLQSSHEGEVAVFALESLPPISPNRGGSVRAMQAFLESRARVDG